MSILYKKHTITANLCSGTFDVQDCTVHVDNTSILVECTFAINSTSPGFLLIQDEHYHINTTLQRLVSDQWKGSVNITGLPAGEYSVTVFDNMEDHINNNPAYVYPDLIHIVTLTNINPTTTTSTGE